MANPHRGALYGQGPSRSREGLSTRSVGNSDEIQLRIDPIHGDLDEEIDGLRGKIKQLKTVAQEIESEAKFQNDFISQLQMTLIKAQAGVKNNMRRLNKSIIQKGSNHVMHVVLFALLCFFAVYFWSKFSRR
ncbi:bet1-like protein [Cinnamomum micranthum f. kanehirae]|uniref:Bet1-like protein n=1 Tax=Cinnamomum micranthum f. kanehirae TaxID=337451 RepID=A0A3S3PG92_9MAGN|nr:bet1-like protein [Cinnamomum micranthum f. kanehirae]